MDKKFSAVVVSSMVVLGAICGYIFYMIFMSTDANLFLHCISTGMIYGAINSFVALYFIHRYSKLKGYNDKLEKEIRIDKLTGLFNRYAFEEDLNSFKENSNHSVIFMDIDDFSCFNNNYGHDAGDEVLRSVATIIKGSIRCIDKAYRYGGEELVVILNDCTKELAVNIGNKIVKNIRNHDNSPYPIVTISAGAASIPDDADNFFDLVKAGDIALYKAKEMGKDRLIPYRSY